MGLISDGTTVFDAGAMASGFGGSMVFISKFTSDGSDATATFTNIDSTYKEYIFIIKNIHPETDGGVFTVNFRDGSTAYDAIKTSTGFIAYHLEDGSASALGYDSDAGLVQATGVQRVAWNIGNENDENIGGYLHLFNPSSTTFVKHYISQMQHNNNNSYSNNQYVAGYCNVTAAIDGVQFKMASGEIQGGTITLYGIS